MLNVVPSNWALDKHGNTFMSQTYTVVNDAKGAIANQI